MLLYGGGLLTGVLLGMLTNWACADSGFGVAVGFLACLAAYVPAVAYRLMMPSGKLRRERSTGQRYIELRRVHPLFAEAIKDRLHAAGLMPANMAHNTPLVATPVSPAPPTRPVVAAAVLTMALIAGLTLLVLIATGASVSACRQAAGGG